MTVDSHIRKHPSSVLHATIYIAIEKMRMSHQRDQRGVPADCWNLGKWGLMEYKWRGSFLGWFVGLVVPVQEIFIRPWLLWAAQNKNFFFPHPTLFQLMCTHPPSNLHGKAVVQGHLSLNVCLRVEYGRFPRYEVAYFRPATTLLENRKMKWRKK